MNPTKPVFLCDGDIPSSALPTFKGWLSSESDDLFRLRLFSLSTFSAMATGVNAASVLLLSDVLFLAGGVDSCVGLVKLSGDDLSGDDLSGDDLSGVAGVSTAFGSDGAPSEFSITFTTLILGSPSALNCSIFTDCSPVDFPEGLLFTSEVGGL